MKIIHVYFNDKCKTTKGYAYSDKKLKEVKQLKKAGKVKRFKVEDLK